MRVEPLLLTEVTTPEWHPIPSTRLPVYGYLLLHPEGPILVDTGVGSGSAFIEEQYRPERRPLPEALGAFGVEVRDVRAVINSHLHFDHCGGNALFAGVPIYVQAAEMEAVEEERYTVRDWVHFDGARYEVVEGELEVATGVRVLPAPGHTPGHQVVLVDGEEGPVLLGGQAAETREEFERPEACARLRALGAVRVYLSHEHAR